MHKGLIINNITSMGPPLTLNSLSRKSLVLSPFEPSPMPSANLGAPLDISILFLLLLPQPPESFPQFLTCFATSAVHRRIPHPSLLYSISVNSSIFRETGFRSTSVFVCLSIVNNGGFRGTLLVSFWYYIYIPPPSLLLPGA